jgi:hypothetical protein
MSDTGGSGRVEDYDARGSYAIRANPDGYEIWDRRDPSHPISSFPGTDTGLEAAENEFARLVREERRGKDRWPPVLRWTLFIALGIWVAASVARSVMEFSLTFAHVAQLTVRWFEVVAAVQNVSFAIWIAALVVLVALWLRRNGRVVEQRLVGSERDGEIAGPAAEE